MAGLATRQDSAGGWRMKQSKRSLPTGSSGNAQNILLLILRRRIQDINRVHLLPLPEPSTTDDHACPVVHACTFLLFLRPGPEDSKNQSILHNRWRGTMETPWQKQKKKKKRKNKEKTKKESRKRNENERTIISGMALHWQWHWAQDYYGSGHAGSALEGFAWEASVFQMCRPRNHGAVFVAGCSG